MVPWKAHLRWSHHRLVMNVNDVHNHWVLQARLPQRQVHRLGLLMMLTGTAQYGGHPLSVVMDAEGGADRIPDVGESGVIPDAWNGWVQFTDARSGGQR